MYFKGQLKNSKNTSILLLKLEFLNKVLFINEEAI